MSKYTREEADAIMRQSRESIELCDRMLAERRDPNSLENILLFTPKAKPEPPRTYSDEIIDRLVGELREQLDEQTRYVSEELSGVLTQVFNDVASNFEELRLDVQSLQNKQSKFLENDVSNLQAENISLRADLDALRQMVESLAAQVASLADDVQSIERSNKVITLQRGVAS